MKIVLILLALIGAGLALQYPLEYHYQYNGRISTAMPRIRHLVAGAGIKCDVVMQMRSANQAIVQLKNVDVGHINMDLKHLRDPLPIDYKPINVAADIIQQPFGVNLAAKEGEDVMEVPSTDIEWITNLRKSIATIFTISPLKPKGHSGNTDSNVIFSSNGEFRPSFKTMETTILGTCESEYTVTKITGPRASKLEAKVKMLKEDAQAGGAGKKSSSGASIPKVSDVFQRAVRSINFDKCSDRVLLQHAGLGNPSMIGRGQFAYVQSRTSVGEFELQGEGEAVRLVEANWESFVITNPYGIKTEQLQAITNQTLRLTAVKEVGAPIPLAQATRAVKTWKYEVMSPFSAPATGAKDWVNFKNEGGVDIPYFAEIVTTGIKLTPEKLNKFKENAIKHLNEAAAELLLKANQVPEEAPKVPIGSRAGEATRKLQITSHLMQTLPKKMIQEIFDEMHKDESHLGDLKKALVIDVISAGGSGPGIKVLLDNMKNGKITNERAATLWMTITNNGIAPGACKDLMEAAKSLNLDKEPFLASAGLVNFANMARLQCLYPTDYTLPIPVLGNTLPPKSLIENDFIPHLVQLLKAASKPWQRVVIVQALGNVGSPLVVQHIRPVVLSDKNMRVRVSAIKALAQTRLPKIVRTEVMSLLMEVIEGNRFNDELRQTAVAVMLTWHPEASWWSRMAISTWYEPSKQMNAFVVTTIQSYAAMINPHLARQTKIAEHVLSLAKPVAPSYRYSFNAKASKLIRSLKMITTVDLAWLTSSKSVFPKEIFTYLKTCFGGFHFEMAEASLVADGLQDIFQRIMDDINSHHLQSSPSSSLPTAAVHQANARDATHRAIQELLTEASKLNTVVRGNKELDGSLYLRFFDNIQHLIPLNKDISNKMASVGRDLLKRMMTGEQPLHLNKFFNPVPITTFIPTEVGLPLLLTVSAPIMNMAEGHIKLQIPGQSEPPSLYELLTAPQIDVIFDVDYKLVTKIISQVKAFVPWSNIAIAVGADSEKTVTLPAKGKIVITRMAEVKSINVVLSPIVQSEVPLVYAHNIPFTMIKNLMPGQTPSQAQSAKVIYVVKDNEAPNIIRHIKFDPKWTGLKSQLKWEADVEFPFTRGHALDLLRHPLESAALLVSPVAKFWRTVLLVNPGESDAKNVRAHVAWVAPRQSSSSSSSSVQIPDFSVDDSTSERLEKLQAAGGNLATISAGVDFIGKKNIQYQVILGYSRAPAILHRTDIILALIRTPIPQQDPNKYSACAVVELEQAQPNSLDTLKEVLQSQIEIKVKGSLHSGKTCQESQVATMTGTIKVTPKRQQILQEEMKTSETMETNDPTVAFTIPAVYDDANIHITYKKDSIPVPLLSMTYNTYDVLRGLAFPHITFNYINANGPKNQIKIVGQRPLGMEKWLIKTTMPEETSYVDGLRLPRFIDSILPVGGLLSSISPSPVFLLPAYLSDKCVISSKQLRTLDGQKYEITPSSCWMLAAKDVRDVRGWMVLARAAASGEPQAKLSSSDESTVVEISKTQVMVNGQPIQVIDKHIVKNSKGEEFCEVIKSSSGHYEIVKLPSRDLTLSVQESVEMTVSPRYKNKLSGLCGPFSGETENELEGPKRCIYTDPELFKFAYTLPIGEHCDVQEVAQKKALVQEFQAKCVTVPSAASSMVLASGPHPTMYVYPVKEEGGMLCVATERIRHCDRNAIRHGTETATENCKCWPESEAPAAVASAKSVGYLRTEPSQPAKETRALTFHVPKECVPRQ